VVRAALSIPRALADLNRKNEGTAKPALAARIAFISAPAARKNPDPLRAIAANVAAPAQQFTTSAAM